MIGRVKTGGKTDLFRLGTFCILLILCGGCERSEKVFTVGIAIHLSLHQEIVEGFKTGMAEYGYVEGKNIRYLYDKPIGSSNQEVIDAAINKLLSQGADLLLTTGYEVSLRAKKAVEGTDVPVIIGGNRKPVEAGLVKSLRRPGGNVTGVWVHDTIPKMLELMMQIIPDAKKFYLPYNPDDMVSVFSFQGLDNTASQLGIEIVFQKVHSFEEALKAVETLPEDIDAIFRVPSPTLDARNSELSLAAIRRGVPMCSILSLDESVLISMAVDFFETGRLAAGIAHKIRLGARPAEIPMAPLEPLLTVNLKTAGELGINIPDGILIQANKIIR
jgi:putative ABC transport system substrate-binding protein